MPSKNPKKLEFNQYWKSDIIYAELESLILKIDWFKSNRIKSSTTKEAEHISYGYSISTILASNIIKNKHDVYRGKDCMKKFCESLKAHKMEIGNFTKKKWFH